MKGQDLQDVQDIGKQELREIFNRSSESVRVVALLSPRCPVCQQGHDVVKALFGRFHSDRLRGVRVWLPMYPGDGQSVAEAEAAAFKDPRLVDTWDPQRELGELFAQTLGLTKTAWDVYLLYAPGIRWEEEEPPEPTFWMHQLGGSYGADPTRFLDPDVLARNLDGILAGDEEQVDHGPDRKRISAGCCYSEDGVPRSWA